MNRTGLTVALIIAAWLGIVCAVDPQLDLDLSAISLDTNIHLFAVNAQSWVQFTRNAARALIALLALPAFVAVFLKLIMPQRRMLIEGRAALFLIATLALGPGVLTNLTLKDHWGRDRPIDVEQFGGTGHFTPWWDPRGDCPNNCSFIAGEPSGAFWTLAPAALAPPQFRALAYAAALAFGVGVGVLRIAAGAHFFSDVVFAGVFMYLLIWLIYAVIYRWMATSISNEAIEDFLVRCSDGLRLVGTTLAAWTRRGGSAIAQLVAKTRSGRSAP
jgi:lipid A 4'-phosphatase